MRKEKYVEVELPYSDGKEKVLHRRFTMEQNYSQTNFQDTMKLFKVISPNWYKNSICK